MNKKIIFISTFLFLFKLQAFANLKQTSKSKLLKCGIDQIEDEVIETIPLTKTCGKYPSNLTQISDLIGGGAFGDYQGIDSVPRGTKYKLSKMQKNSHNTQNLCFYEGCRRLAVSKKGLPPTPSAQRWNVCLVFKGGTSIPHNKSSNCPFAIKVFGKFREFIGDIQSNPTDKCCYETDQPPPP